MDRLVSPESNALLKLETVTWAGAWRHSFALTGSKFAVVGRITVELVLLPARATGYTPTSLIAQWREPVAAGHIGVPPAFPRAWSVLSPPIAALCIKELLNSPICTPKYDLM